MKSHIIPKSLIDFNFFFLNYEQRDREGNNAVDKLSKKKKNERRNKLNDFL